MESYKLTFKRSVAKDLREIPRKDLPRILRVFVKLAEDPRPLGCRKLANQERYRIRLGTYRILYEIRDRELIVLVVKVAYRRDAYRSP